MEQMPRLALVQRGNQVHVGQVRLLLNHLGEDFRAARRVPMPSTWNVSMFRGSLTREITFLAWKWSRGHLAGHQVVLVAAGDGHKHIGVLGAGCLQHAHVGCRRPGR